MSFTRGPKKNKIVRKLKLLHLLTSTSQEVQNRLDSAVALLARATIWRVVCIGGWQNISFLLTLARWQLKILSYYWLHDAQDLILIIVNWILNNLTMKSCCKPRTIFLKIMQLLQLQAATPPPPGFTYINQILYENKCICASVWSKCTIVNQSVPLSIHIFN